MSTQENTVWWKSTNFWNGVILALGGLVIGFPHGAATNAVSSLFALIAAIFSVRDGLSGKHIDLKAWVLDKNTWRNLATVIVSVIPLFPSDAITGIGDLIASALGGNWQGILTALFAVGTSLYFWLKPKPTASQTITSKS